MYRGRLPVDRGSRIGNDVAVTDLDHATGVVGYFLGVRDQDDGMAIRRQFVEQS